MNLSEIPVPRGAHRRSKRLGLGESSGHGKTSGRGTKGQNARSGKKTPPGFEGGQMPFIRRIPKRGFTHLRSVSLDVVNVKDLNRFPSGSVVEPSVLEQSGLVRSKKGTLVKILGEGALDRPLTVKAHEFSKSALEKIASAGGTAERIAAQASPVGAR